MKTFHTMAEVHAYRAQQARAQHLWGQALDLCNDLCHKLDWSHAPEREAKIRRCLARARARLARREGGM